MTKNALLGGYFQPPQQFEANVCFQPYSPPFRTYCQQLVPHLVFTSDEESLENVSEVMGLPVTSPLKSSLASSMVRILTCWAQGEGSREDAAGAYGLLCSYLSEEVGRYKWSLMILIICVGTLDQNFVFQFFTNLFSHVGDCPDLAEFYGCLCHRAPHSYP